MARKPSNELNNRGSGECHRQPTHSPSNSLRYRLKFRYVLGRCFSRDNVSRYVRTFHDLRRIRTPNVDSDTSGWHDAPTNALGFTPAPYLSVRRSRHWSPSVLSEPPRTTHWAEAKTTQTCADRRARLVSLHRCRTTAMETPGCKWNQSRRGPHTMNSIESSPIGFIV